MPVRALAVLLAAIGLVFWPVLGGAFVYDDELLVVQNAALQNGDLLALLTRPLFGDQYGYWRPLTSLLLWLGNSLGGAFGIHALALLLHAAATLVAWSVARRLLGDARRATWAALLFALHPVQVESVGWCSAINDPLWGLCALLCLRSLAAWREGPARALPFAAMAWLLLALLAKENAIAAVPIVLAFDGWLRRRTQPPASGARTWIALAIVLAVWWLLRALVFGDAAAGLLREPGPTPPGASAWLQPTALLGAHARVLAVPWSLTPFRTTDAFDAYCGGPLATLAAALLLVAAWRAKQTLRLVVLALLVAPLLPTLGAGRSIGAYPVADRYLYLAAFGLALAIASVNGPRARWLALGLAALFGALSFVQTWVWRDQPHLVRHALAQRPDDATLWRMTGDLALARAARDPGALGYARDAYQHALSLCGTATAGTADRARAEAELGLAWCMFREQGGLRGPGTPALLAAFQRAVDGAPDSAAAWVGLGVAYGIAERPAAAEQSLRKALALAPSNADAWFNLGSLQARNGRRDAARESLAEALRCNPHYAAAKDLLDRLR
jgi:tetratricopeptide (TPR) repeat protein